MVNSIFRSYELKNMKPENVKRSLQGAIRRSLDNRLYLMITTKSIVLPDEYNQIKISGGGSFFDAETDGDVEEGFLTIFLYLYKKKGNNSLIYESEATIKLSCVDSLYVTYEER